MVFHVLVMNNYETCTGMYIIRTANSMPCMYHVQTRLYNNECIYFIHTMFRPCIYMNLQVFVFMLMCRQIASLTAQCRQVYCLVEMAPSAPSWRPPRNGVSSTASQAGENDQTNVATQQSFQAFSTHPTLRRSRRRRTAPSDPSLIQPSG